jgi:hypothetical protein
MEVVLILGEFRRDAALRLLIKVAVDRSSPSELRAAAAWGMCSAASSLAATPLLRLLADEDELVAVHALVSASRLLDDDGLTLALSHVGEDENASAGIIRAVLAARSDPLPKSVAALRLATGVSRSWLVYLLGMLGRARCEGYLRIHAPEVLDELSFFWTRHGENWTNRLDVADQIDFQLAQLLD